MRGAIKNVFDNISNPGKSLGDIHKQRGQLRRKGICQMSILLHKPYVLNVSSKGEGQV